MPPSGTFRKITAGYGVSAGIRTDGTIAVWGLGDTIPPPPGKFVDISASNQWLVARRVDGTLAAWGFQAFPIQTVPSGQFIAVSASETCFGIAIRPDGTLVHWGCSGQNGVLAQVPAGPFVAVAAGGDFALALRADGSVVAWGQNQSNQLNVPPGKYLAVDAGDGHAIGIRLCYPNCDGSTSSPVLTANDFQCFINRYATQDPRANCDQSTMTPQLTANDFQCFLNAFATGCP